MHNSRALNAFLASVEQRALRLAVAATHSRDEALDLVQDAMVRLAQRYGDRDEREWAPLFFRILERRILDWHRRMRVKRAVFAVLPFGDRDAHDDALAEAPDPAGRTPESELAEAQALARLEQAIGALPLRQQQVFLLRRMQGFDVGQTAEIMQCSSGSVKTHYHRAQTALRAALGDVLE